MASRCWRQRDATIVVCFNLSLVQAYVRTYAYLARVDGRLEAVTRHAALLVVDVAKLTALGTHGLWSRALPLSRVCVGAWGQTDSNMM